MTHGIPERQGRGATMRAPSAEPGRRRILRAGAAAAIVLGAGACARIPVSSGIVATPIGQAQDGSAPYVQPRPPAPGADPAQIVEGFVRAGVGADDDYAIARSYLTAQARDAWNPRSGVTVYAADTGSATPSAGAPGEITMRVLALAQVDALGVRTALASPSQREIDIALEQVDGQWRISRPPAGIFLSEPVFEILFTPGRLYHLDAAGRRLVPDVRWVAAQEQTQALLRHLGGRPAPFLADAVRSAVPAQLATEGTSISTAGAGELRVDVPSVVRTLPAERRRLAVTQILATVRSLHLLGDVRIMSDGADLTHEEDAGLHRPLPGHRALGAAEHGIVALADGIPGAAPVQLVPALGDRVVLDPCASAAAGRAAALGADATSVLLCPLEAAGDVREVALGAPGAPPRCDDTGRVWTARRDGTPALLALAAQGPELDAEIEALWLQGRETVGLDISADGTRMLVVSALEGATRLDLCAVVRDDAGAPLSVTDPMPVTLAVDSILQATWYDETSVAVLGTVDDAQGRALVHDLAGTSDPMPDPPMGTTRLAGSAMSGVAYCSDESGALHRGDGTAWTRLALSARCPSFY